ncbi:MAG: hypothetical protein KGY99_03610 [Phycisphaerae bacterium]|nr:hypothetical protein [Phycisphaerae bacterium]
MNVVTSANHDFAHCLRGLVASVHAHYGRGPIVYDVGLTEPDRAGLDAEFVAIDPGAGAFDYAGEGDSRFICTTHKPACIADYWRRHDEPMLFVDADCLFRRRVEPEGEFDLGVTVRSGKGFDADDPWNGVINAGVLIFKNPARPLLDAWAAGCRQQNVTDQKVLVDLLGEAIDWPNSYDRTFNWRGVTVKVFAADALNDYHLRDGAIWHFKGLRHEPEIYRALLAAAEEGRDVYRLFRRMRRRRRSWWQRLLGRGYDEQA